MSHERYLKDLLRPLGVYDLEGVYNGGELAAMGAALDDCKRELEYIADEMMLDTAAGEGLGRFSELFPYRPVTQTGAGRRLALAALLRIGGDSFTPSALADTLGGCGLRVELQELGPNQVTVRFCDVRGEPAGFIQMKEILEKILPAQVGIIYDFWYASWDSLEGFFPTWDDLEGLGMTWGEVEVYPPYTA